MLGAYLMLLGVSLIWSTNFIIGKALAASVPPFTIMACRALLASIILGGWLLSRRRKLPPAGSFVQFLILGLTGVFLFNSLIYTSLRYTSAVNATIINAFCPIVTIFMGVLMLSEKVSMQQYLGALISLAGIFLIASHGSWANIVNLSFNNGDLIVLADTVIWAFFSVYGKKVMQTTGPIETVAYSTLAALPFCLVAAALELRDYNFAALTWPVVSGMLYLGLFASVIALIWWYTGIHRLGVAVAAIFYNLIPVFAMVIAALFLQEEIHYYQLIGCFFVLIGIVLSSQNKKEQLPERVDGAGAKS